MPAREPEMPPKSLQFFLVHLRYHRFPFSVRLTYKDSLDTRFPMIKGT